MTLLVASYARALRARGALAREAWAWAAAWPSLWALAEELAQGLAAEKVGELEFCGACLFFWGLALALPAAALLAAALVALALAALALAAAPLAQLPGPQSFFILFFYSKTNRARPRRFFQIN